MEKAPTAKPKSWRFGKPYTPRDGYITTWRLWTGRFDVVYKVGASFRKKTVTGLRILRELAKMEGFRYANVYDHVDRVQVLSYTNKKKVTWFVKRVPDSMVYPRIPPKPMW